MQAKIKNNQRQASEKSKVGENFKVNEELKKIKIGKKMKTT